MCLILIKPQLCELDFLGKSAISQDFTGIQLLSHFSPLNCSEAQSIFIIELWGLQENVKQHFLQPQRPIFSPFGFLQNNKDSSKFASLFKPWSMFIEYIKKKRTSFSVLHMKCYSYL